MAIAQTPLTLEEFLALPEQEPPLEFECGKVTPKMAPQSYHSVIQFTLAERINRVALPVKRAFAFPELRTTVDERSYVPDIAVYRWERVPRDANGRPIQHFRTLPDVAIEIALPGQSTSFLTRRCVWYTANGSLSAVLVDPQDESVVLFRPGKAPESLQRGDDLRLPEIDPGLVIPLSELFDSLNFS
jgi:Uma2 family endonuclease